MTAPTIAVFAAQGERSFSPAQLDTLRAAGTVTFFETPGPPNIEHLSRALKNVHIAALTPRAARGVPADSFVTPGLRAVCIPTTGYEWLDTQGLFARDIAVSTVPDFSSASCAEFTIGLIIALARGVCDMRFRPGPTTPPVRPGLELANRTLGIIGMGNVGTRVGAAASALGMNVIGSDPRPWSAGAAPVSLDTLLAQSDIVSVHAPLNVSTRAMLARTAFERSRRGVLFVNTARPGLVDTDAMDRALELRMVGGYAFDIGYATAESFARLIARENVLAFPHASWYTREAVKRGQQTWVEHIAAAARGQILDAARPAGAP